MGTEIEMLVVGNCLLLKEAQNAALRMNYSDAFDLD
jgi:carbamoyltransferase